MDILTQLGVGGIFAVLVIRSVLDFLSRRKNDAGAFITFGKSDVDALQKGVEALSSAVTELKSAVDERYLREREENVEVKVLKKELLRALRDVRSLMGP